MGTKKAIGGYFGLTVEVLTRMANCSLIRYRERVFIVDTLDLDNGGQKAPSPAAPFRPENNVEIKDRVKAAAA